MKHSFFTAIERKMIKQKNLLIIRGIIIDSHRRNQPIKGRDIIGEIKNNLGFTVLFKRDSSNAISNDDYYYFDSTKCKFNPIIFSYMDSIYTTCLNNNIKLAFVELPVNNATFKNLSKTNYIAFLGRLKQTFSVRYPQIDYYDKFKQLPNINFGDENHMNIRGSNYYSNEFSKNYFKN